MAFHGLKLESAHSCAFSGTKRVQAEISMLDVIVLALGLGFFAAAVGYTYACERL
jgi:hypothetical protein